MPRRNSPLDLPDLSALTQLPDVVVDKRQDQRSSAKRNRRNRHYEKQFIRNTLARLPQQPRNGAWLDDDPSSAEGGDLPA